MQSAIDEALIRHAASRFAYDDTISAGTGDGRRGPLGSHVFVLKGGNRTTQGMSWVAIDYGGQGESADVNTLRRISTDANFVARLQKKNMHPGMMLVITDLPLEANTRSGKDFVIMSADGA